jgi:hypothetical protein
MGLYLTKGRRDIGCCRAESRGLSGWRGAFVISDFVPRALCEAATGGLPTP